MPRTDGTIAGLVTDDAGLVPGAAVRLYNRASGALVAATTADSSGGYTFGGLDPGDVQSFVTLALHPTRGDLNATVLDRLTPVGYNTRFVPVAGTPYSSFGTTNVYGGGDPFWAQVSALFQFSATATDTYTHCDSGPHNFGASPGFTQNAGFAKFGNWCWNPGSSDVHTEYTGASMVFMAGDFTIESWIFRAYASGNPETFIGKISSWPTGIDFAFEIEASASKASFVIAENADAIHELVGFYDFVPYQTRTPVAVLSDASIPIGAWVHLAACRRAGVTTLYVDGVPQSSPHTEPTPTTDTVTLATGDVVYGNTYSGPSGTFTRTTYPSGTCFVRDNLPYLRLGAGYDTGNFFNGGIEELRITKAARYDGTTFAVPTAPYPAY